MLRFIALRGVRALRTWHLLLLLKNKQQIMQNNVETQHKHMYS